MRRMKGAFVGNADFEQTYAELSRSLYQEEIHRHFDFASNLYEVGIERVKGSLIFENLKVRIDKAIEETQTGNKISDDYKTLIFNKDEQARAGCRFNFSDNIWLAINSSRFNVESYALTCKRCNNNFHYLIDGVVKTEPCVIEYATSDNSFKENKQIITPGKSIKIYAQENDFTNKIKIDNRFIFGRQVFKVVAIQDFLQLNTDENEVGLITFNLDYDPISPSDDFNTKIAFGGIEIITPVTTFEEESEKEQTMKISKQEVKKDLKLKLSPDRNYVREGDSTLFKIMDNGENVTDRCKIVLETDIPNKMYEFKLNQKTFKLTCNNKVYDKKIKLKVEYQEEMQIFDIELRGLF